MPETVDPQPGPYIVPVARAGPTREDLRIAAFAASQWTAAGFDAFSICYRSASEAPANLPQPALQAVAVELKKGGAKSVTMPNGGVCEQPYRSGVSPPPHVEIMGRITL